MEDDKFIFLRWYRVEKMRYVQVLQMDEDIY